MDATISMLLIIDTLGLFFLVYTAIFGSERIVLAAVRVMLAVRYKWIQWHCSWRIWGWKLWLWGDEAAVYDAVVAKMARAFARALAQAKTPAEVAAVEALAALDAAEVVAPAA